MLCSDSCRDSYLAYPIS